MKAKRLLLILGPFVCVVLVLVAFHALTGDLPRARTSGEKLNVATLAADEEITVNIIFSHRTTKAHEYQLRRTNGDLVVAVFYLDVTWRDGAMVKRPDQSLGTHTLSPKEARGLDAMIAYFRARREEHSSAFRETAILHRRGGKVIGEESYVGFSLPGDLDYLDHETAKTTHDYDRLADRHGLTRAELDRLVPFERLRRLVSESK